GDVPRGTRVLGVDLGGRSRADAERLLRERVAGHAADPVRIRLDGRYHELAAARHCLRVDVDRSIDRAIRGTARLAGHHDVPPVVRLDRNRLDEALRALIDPARVTMRRPGITF